MERSKCADARRGPLCARLPSGREGSPARVRGAAGVVGDASPVAGDSLGDSAVAASSPPCVRPCAPAPGGECSERGLCGECASPVPSTRSRRLSRRQRDSPKGAAAVGGAAGGPGCVCVRKGIARMGQYPSNPGGGWWRGYCPKLKRTACPATRDAAGRRDPVTRGGANARPRDSPLRVNVIAQSYVPARHPTISPSAQRRPEGACSECHFRWRAPSKAQLWGSSPTPDPGPPTANASSAHPIWDTPSPNRPYV